MPKVFLSPAQHAKPCLVKGCSEAYHCNLIADAMEPELKRVGIDYLRNDRGDEVPAHHVAKSNAYGADVHFTFHTNGGGGCRCTFYNNGKADSVALSEEFAKEYANVYPYLIKPSAQYPPSGCRAFWTELTAVKATAIYAEQWFHDNAADSAWGHAHIVETAKSHVRTLCKWFGINYENPREEISKEEQPMYIIHGGIYSLSNKEEAGAALEKVKALGYKTAYLSQINDCLVVRASINLNRSYALRNAEQIEKAGVKNAGIVVR